MKPVAGTCYIKMDGEQFDVEGSVEIPLTNVERSTVMGLSGPAGLKEIATVPYIKFSAIFGPDFPLERIQKSIDLTITAELRNGKTYAVSGAACVGKPTANPVDGTTELTFEGERGIWQ